MLSLLGTDSLKPVKQNNEEATHVGKFEKNFGEIIWSESALVIERKVRGLNSWPSAYTFFRGKRLKVWEAKVVESNPVYGINIAEGGICAVDKDAVYVQTGKDILMITEVQLEGKKKMSVKEFLLGYQIKPGEKLGKVEE